MSLVAIRAFLANQWQGAGHSLVSAGCGLLLVLMAFTGGALADTPSLRVADAWVRGVPERSVWTGYLVIENAMDRPLRLVEVRSPDFEHVEIHATRIVQGAVTMKQIKSLEIPARGRLALLPNGPHLMLFRPRRALSERGSAILELGFENGERMRITAVVRQDAPPPGPHGAH